MSTSSTLRAEQVVNRSLLPWLQMAGITQAAALWVCEQRPDSHSWAVLRSTDEVLGTLVTGIQDNLIQVPGYWLAAAHAQAAQVLLEKLHGEREFQVNVPLWAVPLALSLFPNAKASTNLLYICTPADFRRVPTGPNFVQLTPEIMRRDVRELDVRRALGPLAAFPKGAYVYGLRAGDAGVVAVAEAIIETDLVVLIEQVYTSLTFRGRGYAKELVRGVTETVLKRNRIAGYLVADDNVPSIHVCTAVGYQLLARIGVVEVA